MPSGAAPPHSSMQRLLPGQAPWLAAGPLPALRIAPRGFATAPAHRPLLIRQHAVRDSIPLELIPTWVKGTWRKPALSLRMQAEIRKKAVIEGKLLAGRWCQTSPMDRVLTLANNTQART